MHLLNCDNAMKEHILNTPLSFSTPIDAKLFQELHYGLMFSVTL